MNQWRRERAQGHGLGFGVGDSTDGQALHSEGSRGLWINGEQARRVRNVGAWGPRVPHPEAKWTYQSCSREKGLD